MHDEFIAVFDSGVGGVSVLRELVKLMPEENYLYFGDSANAPYGDRDVDEVRALSVKNVGMLIEKGAKAVVIACNTATSAAVEQLRDMYLGVPIIGIEPAVKPAVEFKIPSVIVVMATEVTLKEKKFNDLIAHFSDTAEIIPLPCHGLAELVEAGKTECEETREYLKEILEPYIDRMDSVVLGCTHYPFVSGLIKEIIGNEIPIFDGGEGTAKETMRRLNELGIRCLGKSPGHITFMNSCGSEKMLDLCKKLLKNQK